MAEEEAATIDGQFFEFAKLQDNRRDGLTITLYRQDYWMRQAKIMDDRKVTMTDTGILFFKLCKTEITFDEWYELLTELCVNKELDQEFVENAMTNCGIPGTSQVIVPAYRTFFYTYKFKVKMFFDGPESDY